jgi:chemotaxis protein methyltransferase CheR
VTNASRAGANRDPGGSPYRIDDREFGLFQALVERESGIQLPDAKRLLLVGRLARRLRALKLESFEAYYRRVREDGDELVRMIDLISTNETHFFREPKQFEFLERNLLPVWAVAAGGRPGRVRAWSAACSTGEEPYSIAMTLLSQLPGWEVEVLATDLSTRVLENARAAVWPIEKVREIPERHLKAFMLRGIGDRQGYMRAGPELRGVVRFERLNLHGSCHEVDGLFDLIFCRNVLIYFSAAGRAAVVTKLVDRLAPGGHLFLGHAETLNGITDRLRSAGPTVFSAPPPSTVDRTDRRRETSPADSGSIHDARTGAGQTGGSK